mmetsp:Transcript_2921/g.9118  ORF Transcript_2921/g.9118 Transcript_2921/m.9118 type:complete len:298 (+) Transcript_2921:1374-2267(+)
MPCILDSISSSTRSFTISSAANALALMSLHATTVDMRPPLPGRDSTMPVSLRTSSQANASSSWARCPSGPATTDLRMPSTNASAAACSELPPEPGGGRPAAAAQAASPTSAPCLPTASMAVKRRPVARPRRKQESALPAAWGASAAAAVASGRAGIAAGSSIAASKASMAWPLCKRRSIRTRPDTTRVKRFRVSTSETPKRSQFDSSKVPGRGFPEPLRAGRTCTLCTEHHPRQLSKSRLARSGKRTTALTCMAVPRFDKLEVRKPSRWLYAYTCFLKVLSFRCRVSARESSTWTAW